MNRDAALRINARLGRVALSNFGDVKPVRDGLSEFGINYGPGYRVYFIVITVLKGMRRAAIWRPPRDLV